MKKTLIAILVSTAALASSSAFAQNISVATNLGKWAELGTMNIEAGFAINQHLSAHLDVAVNPWTFRNADEDDRYSDIVSSERNPFQYKRESVGVSLRYWPWHVFSGFGLRGKAQYYAYDIGGIRTRERSVGDMVGLSIGAGYALMIGKDWNLDLGVAGWGGWRTEKVYESIETHSRPVEKPGRWFIFPEEIVIGITHIF